VVAARIGAQPRIGRAHPPPPAPPPAPGPTPLGASWAGFLEAAQDLSPSTMTPGQLDEVVMHRPPGGKLVPAPWKAGRAGQRRAAMGIIVGCGLMREGVSIGQGARSSAAFSGSMRAQPTKGAEIWAAGARALGHGGGKGQARPDVGQGVDSTTRQHTRHHGRVSGLRSAAGARRPTVVGTDGVTSASTCIGDFRTRTRGIWQTKVISAHSSSSIPAGRPAAHGDPEGRAP